MGYSTSEYQLNEILKIKYGKNQKKVQDNEKGKYPILGTGGLMGYANEYLYDKPSVLIGRKGSINKVKYIDKPFWTVDTLFYTEVNEEIVFPKYIYYYLSTIDFNHYNEGTTIPSLRTETLNRITLEIPTLKYQKKVLKILNSIDDKIELNIQIISNLEQLAQTLFKRWLVDFEFPNENGEPYCSSGGKMVESGLGLIPEEWGVGTLESLGQIVGGGTPSKKRQDYYSQQGIPWITPKDLSNDKSIFINKGALDITEEALKKSSAKLFPENSILFSSRAPIGYIAIAGVELSTNQGFKSIVPKKGKPSEFIFFLLKHLTPVIESNAGGSTFKEISGKGMKELKSVIPSDNMLLSFQGKVRPLFEKIKRTEKEIRTLIELRDTLLPKLLSGELELPSESEVADDVPIS